MNTTPTIKPERELQHSLTKPTEGALFDLLKNTITQRDALHEALAGFLKRYEQIGYSDLLPMCKARAYQILGSPDQAWAALKLCG